MIPSIRMKMICQRILRILTSSIVLLILAACAGPAWQPVSGDYYIEESYAIIHTDSLQIALKPRAYRGSYQDANSRYFPVYIKVSNSSQSRITLLPNSLVILADGKQYDPIPLEYVLARLRDQIYFENWQEPFSEDPLITENRERDLDQYYELMGEYFNFGELLPSASKEGFLFYPLAAGRADSLRIDAWGHMVHFTRK